MISRRLYDCLRNRGTFKDVQHVLDEANLSFRDLGGRTPLHVYCYGYRYNTDRNSLKVLDLLLESGLNVDDVDEPGLTLLMYLIMYGFPLDHVDMVLCKMADINHRDNSGNSVLNFFASGYLKSKNEIKSTQVLKSLIEWGASVDRVNGDGETLLMKLLEFKYPISSLQMLLDVGADINSRDKQGKNILHKFASYYAKCSIPLDHASPQDLSLGAESVKVLKFLVERGADVNCRDNDGVTPLMLIVKNGFPFDYMEIILDRGVDICAEDNQGSNIFTFLIKSLNARSCSSRNSLCSENPLALNVVQKLLEFGANRNNFYLSHISCNYRKYRKNYVAFVQMLYNYGVNFNWKLIIRATVDIVLYGNVNAPLPNIFDTCHNIFCQAIFKCALFQDRTYLDHCLTVSKLKDVSRLSVYVDSSYEELAKMKTQYLTDGLTVYDFFIETDCQRLGSYFRSGVVDAAVLEVEFPLYADIIQSKAKIGSRWAIILCKLDSLSLSSKFDTEVALNYDCIRHITRFLNYYQITKLVAASEITKT